MEISYMKKLSLVFACTLTAQMLFTPSLCAQQGETVPHRKIYGFFLGNSDFQTGAETVYGIGSLYADQPHVTELIYPFSDNEALYAGAAVDGIYYGCSYVYEMQGPPSPGNLIAIDLNTKERTDIGPWTDTSDGAYSNLRMQDMTYSYADETMYAVGFEMGTSSLFSIDLETGKTTKTCDLSNTIGVIAANHDGEIYGIDGNYGSLYKINKETGDMSLICETGLGGLAQNQGLEFDHTDGSLYWSCNSYDKDGGNDFYLIRFKLQDNTATFEEIGKIGNPLGVAKLSGLYIPFVLTGEDAPAKPENVTITPDSNGQLKATLSWNNPGKTFGGKELADINTVTIIRNNESIATIQAEAINEPMQWTDENIPAPGTYQYIIYATNSVGDGEKAYAAQYIGADVPAKVTGITAETTDNCTQISLQWNKVEQGEHGAFVDPQSIRYTVKRYPDESIIAENISECNVTDKNIKRLASYHYEITASNETGATKAYSNAVIAGPALAMPYIETFADNSKIANNWTVEDSNEDLYTWIFSSGAGQYTFGDAIPAAEYYINPTFTPQEINKDANEWLITPPLRFQAGKSYTLTFDYRCITDENIIITMGDLNNAKSQEGIQEITLEAIDMSSSDFSGYEVSLPEMSEDKVKTIGFNLLTPFPATMMSFIQITNIEVKEKSHAIDAEAEKTAVSLANGKIMIDGNFKYAELYTIEGKMAGRTTLSEIPTDNMEKGIWLVRVITGNKAEAFKIQVR